MSVKCLVVRYFVFVGWAWHKIGGILFGINRLIFCFMIKYWRVIVCYWSFAILIYDTLLEGFCLVLAVRYVAFFRLNMTHIRGICLAFRRFDVGICVFGLFRCAKCWCSSGHYCGCFKYSCWLYFSRSLSGYRRDILTTTAVYCLPGWLWEWKPLQHDLHCFRFWVLNLIIIWGYLFVLVLRYFRSWSWELGLCFARYFLFPVDWKDTWLNVFGLDCSPSLDDCRVFTTQGGLLGTLSWLYVHQYRGCRDYSYS